jgi:ribose transport system substrate-binding protein
MKLRRRGALALAAAAVVLLAVAAAVGGSASAAPSQAHAKKWKIVVSNNYMGNEWRPQMENAVKWVASQPQYKDKVDLQIRNVQLTPTAQIQSLQSIIRQRPDAILVDAASATALNPTIAQACKAGILVFSFDQVVTAPCAYKFPEDYAAQAHDMIEWLATTLHGKGNILMDQGLQGIPISETFVKIWTSTIKSKFPGIKVVGTYSSQYAPGPELQAVSSLVAQNPKIDGVLSGAYQSSIIKALKAANRKLVPMTGLDVNGNETECAKAKIPCFFFGAPSWVGALALEHAVNLLEHTATYPKNQPYFTTNFVTKQGNFKFNHKQKVQVLTPGVNWYPTQSPSLITPITYGSWKMTAKDVLGK